MTLPAKCRTREITVGQATGNPRQVMSVRSSVSVTVQIVNQKVTGIESGVGTTTRATR